MGLWMCAGRTGTGDPCQNLAMGDQGCYHHPSAGSFLVEPLSVVSARVARLIKTSPLSTNSTPTSTSTSMPTRSSTPTSPVLFTGKRSSPESPVEEPINKRAMLQHFNRTLTHLRAMMKSQHSETNKRILRLENTNALLLTELNRVKEKMELAERVQFERARHDAARLAIMTSAVEQSSANSAAMTRMTTLVENCVNQIGTLFRRVLGQELPSMPLMPLTPLTPRFN